MRLTKKPALFRHRVPDRTELSGSGCVRCAISVRLYILSGRTKSSHGAKFVAVPNGQLSGEFRRLGFTGRYFLLAGGYLAAKAGPYIPRGRGPVDPPTLTEVHRSLSYGNTERPARLPNRHGPRFRDAPRRIVGFRRIAPVAERARGQSISNSHRGRMISASLNTYESALPRALDGFCVWAPNIGVCGQSAVPDFTEPRPGWGPLSFKPTHRNAPGGATRGPQSAHRAAVWMWRDASPPPLYAGGPAIRSPCAHEVRPRRWATREQLASVAIIYVFFLATTRISGPPTT